MNSPQRQERRDARYPLKLPVSVKLDREEMRVESENISLGGILLSSDFPIPEGSTVDLAIGVSHVTFLSARGKVVRVEAKIAGNFSVAVAFECLSLAWVAVYKRYISRAPAQEQSGDGCPLTPSKHHRRLTARPCSDECEAGLDFRIVVPKNEERWQEGASDPSPFNVFIKGTKRSNVQPLVSTMQYPKDCIASNRLPCHSPLVAERDFHELEHDLEEARSKLNVAEDPQLRRDLLLEMGRLLVEVDSLNRQKWWGPQGLLLARSAIFADLQRVILLWCGVPRSNAEPLTLTVEAGRPSQDLDSIAAKIIKPVLTKNKREWKGFHAGRRGLGTVLRQLTGNGTAGRDVLGHEDEGVTKEHDEGALPVFALMGLMLEAKVKVDN
jgi:PilZ domain